MILGKSSIAGRIDALVVNEDPTATSVNATEGSIIIYKNSSGANKWYYKMTTGDDTNVMSIAVRSNETASAPTVNDDETLGYSKFSSWIDTAMSDYYVCIDATDGAASWLKLNG